VSSDSHFKDLFTLPTRTGSFIQDLKTPLNCLFYVSNCLFRRLALRMASGKGRTTYIEAAILRIGSQDNLKFQEFSLFQKRW
jgi:hypothetical protein